MLKFSMAGLHWVCVLAKPKTRVSTNINTLSKIIYLYIFMCYEFFLDLVQKLKSIRMGVSLHPFSPKIELFGFLVY